MRHKMLFVMAAIAALLPSYAAAQFNPLGILFGIFEDKLTPRQTVAAGVCSVNVYAIVDGEYVPLTTIDGGLSYVVSFDGPIALQPVPIINSADAPRWLDVIHQSSMGFRKLQRIKVRGGKVHGDGSVSNNAGFVDKHGKPAEAPIFEVGDLPMLVNAFTVSWGRGQAATFRFNRVRWTQFFDLFNNEKIRAGMHGAGQVVYPQMPSVFGVGPDGQPRNFSSQEELQAVMGNSSKAPKTTPTAPEIGGGELSVDRPNVRESQGGILWQYGYAPTATRMTDEEVQAKVARATESKLLGSGSIAERRGHKTYFLLRSTSTFKVELYRGGSSSTWRSNAKISGNGFELAFKATLAAGDRIEVIDDQNRRTMLTVVGEEG